MPAGGVLDVAMHLASLCASPDAEMVLITGSVARGLSDTSSDIDLYLYRLPDANATRSMLAALSPAEATLVFGVLTPTGRFEKFRVGGRFVDVEQVSANVLQSALERIDSTDVSDSDVKVAAGLQDAIAVVGAPRLKEWNERLVLTDRVACAMVARLAPRLLSTRAMYDLTWARSDELSYVARVSKIALAAIGLVGAVNRRWIPIEDPKWLPWQLERLVMKPSHALARVRAAIRTPTPQSADDLDSLIVEVLDLVDDHIDQANTRSARFALQIRP